MSEYRLSKEKRRAVCVHEAGHAVIYALGGAWVYRVAVAPEGATEWQTTGRKGGALADLWGICCPSDAPGSLFIHWDAENNDWGANPAGFRAQLRQLSDFLVAGKHGDPRKMRRETWRQIRAHVCAALAGPAAEQIHDGEAPWVDYEGEWGTFDDAKQAQCLAWLLPRRGELERLHALTVDTLRQPEVWASVLRLADELERVGDIEEGLEHLLPARIKNWPTSPEARGRA